MSGAPEALPPTWAQDLSIAISLLGLARLGKVPSDAASNARWRLDELSRALAALVEAQQPVAHVQQSAEIEHVAGDVSKNGPESNMAQQPCPTCAALARTVMLDQVSFDRKPDCYGIRQITDDESVEAWEDIRTSPDVAREEANDMMATGRGEIYEVVPLWTTPQPSPTPQADSQPAPQGETNAQLDIDSNSSAPGQQRDVAGSVALGQPVGNGSDQAAGHTGAQGDKLLIVAERNIRSFLRSAVFKSESDREAALNCVDVLWEAARAPADSVTAPAGWQAVPVTPTSDQLNAACEPFLNWQANSKNTGGPIQSLGAAIYRAMLAAAPAQPAQAADSVLEDAARLEQIAEAIRDYHHALDMRKHGGLAESAAFSSICNTMGMHWNRGEEAARRAARKQGGA